MTVPKIIKVSLNLLKLFRKSVDFFPNRAYKHYCINNRNTTCGKFYYKKPLKAKNADYTAKYLQLHNMK